MTNESILETRNIFFLWFSLQTFSKCALHVTSKHFCANAIICIFVDTFLFIRKFRLIVSVYVQFVFRFIKIFYVFLFFYTILDVEQSQQFIYKQRYCHTTSLLNRLPIRHSFYTHEIILLIIIIRFLWSSMSSETVITK